MAYIGNKLADSYTSFAKQDFTTSATTSYTLDYPVTNENEIALFINFVRQEPTTAYTASGTTLTLTSATSASDDMYCVFLGKALQTVNPPAGSVGLSQLSATGTASASTYLRGDNSWSAVSVNMTPAFEASASTNQDSAYAVFAKVNFDTEVFDTDSCYDNTTNYRFTPTTAGKYFVYCTVYVGSTTNNEIDFARVAIYKNGTEYKRNAFSPDNAYDADKLGISVNTVIDMNGTSDYLEVYYYVDTSVGTNQKVIGATLDNVFGAYKLLGV